jgi:2-desacetyl-2-hydroxyethyl bacteriochlorophyllide A dehydrogenase
LRALHFVAPRTLELVEIEPPARSADDALVAPAYVGLCGTDLELLEGSMPYFGEGVARYPLQPGHEVCGVVVEGSSLAAGTAVLIDPVAGCGSCPACATGFQTRCPDRRELGVRLGMPGGACELIAVPAANLHPLPPGVSPRDAVLAEPGVTALNAVERLGPVAGERALVVGAGTVGLIAAQLLASRGASVDVLVVEPPRAALVERLGARPVEAVEESAYTGVIEAAGAPEAVRGALAAVAPGGTVSVAGVQPGPIDALDVNPIVLKDATVRGVLNGPGLYGRMLDEIASGAVDAAALIEAEFPLEDAGAALAALQTTGRSTPKIVLQVG